MRNVQPNGWLDLAKEPAISLTKASRLPQYQRDGKASNPSTVYRHAINGVLRNGQRVYLEHVRQGGRVVTTAQAVARFFARLASTDTEVPVNPTAVKSAHRDAARRLALQGI